MDERRDETRTEAFDEGSTFDDVNDEKLILELHYNVKTGHYSWDYPHRLNAYLLLGLLDCVKDDLIGEIKDATDRELDDDEC